MKIAHISDIHYAPKTLDEVDRCFAFAVERAIDEQCEVAVLSGDLFDHRVDVHSPAVSRLMAQVARLADAMPVLILQGTYSHDVPGSLDVFKTMGRQFPVFVADRICQVLLAISASGRAHFMPSDSWSFEENIAATFAHFVLDDKPANVAVFSCLPSVNKGAVAAIVGAENAAEAVGEHIYNLLKGWSPVNLAARARDISTVLVSHGTVSGCITEQGVPMAGLDHEFTTGTLFAAETTAVMLGHIHQHQEWHDFHGRAIAYPGSVGRLHFGEVNPKGFLIWNVGTTRSLPRFIETPAKKLLQIDFPGTPDMTLLEQYAAGGFGDFTGAHIRIRYSVDEEHRHRVDKEAVRALMEVLNPAEVKIEGRVNPIQRTRSEGITRMSLDDKLVKWGEVTETETDPLRERLRLLEHQEPEAIVAEVLGEKTKKEKAA